MIELKLPLSQKQALGAAAALIIFALGGYLLYFHAQSQSHTNEKTLVMLRQKAIDHAQVLADMQKKYDSANEALQKTNQEYEANLQIEQDCKAKQEALQAKYEALMQSNEKLKNELVDAHIKLGISNELPATGTSPAPATSTSTPTSTPPTMTHP